MTTLYINNVPVQATDVAMHDMMTMLRDDFDAAERRPYSKGDTIVVGFGIHGFNTYTTNEQGRCVRKVWAQGLLRQVYVAFDADAATDGTTGDIDGE